MPGVSHNVVPSAVKSVPRTEVDIAAGIKVVGASGGVVPVHRRRNVVTVVSKPSKVLKASKASKVSKASKISTSVLPSRIVTQTTSATASTAPASASAPTLSLPRTIRGKATRIGALPTGLPNGLFANGLGANVAVTKFAKKIGTGINPLGINTVGINSLGITALGFDPTNIVLSQLGTLNDTSLVLQQQQQQAAAPTGGIPSQQAAAPAGGIPSQHVASSVIKMPIPAVAPFSAVAPLSFHGGAQGRGRGRGRGVVSLNNPLLASIPSVAAKPIGRGGAAGPVLAAPKVYRPRAGPLPAAPSAEIPASFRVACASVKGSVVASLATVTEGASKQTPILAHAPVSVQRKAGSASSVLVDPVLMTDEAKKKRRLERNRQSARDCRRRKKEHAAQVASEIAHLEAANLSLRLQLRVGEEADGASAVEERCASEVLAALLKRGAPEREVRQSLEEFKEKFADYGRDRRSAIEYHLQHVGRLLQPTTTTSMAMAALQNSTTEKPMEGVLKILLASSSSTIPIVSPSPTPATTPPKRNLFELLVNYLKVNEEQAAALKDSRFVAEELDRALHRSSTVLDELRANLTTVGQQMGTEFGKIREILTPSQIAKFVIWVNNNTAAMEMLDELWSAKYHGENREEAKKINSGAEATKTRGEVSAGTATEMMSCDETKKSSSS